MITTLLSIRDINNSLIHVLNVMMMIFAPLVALTMLYVFAIRPVLRILRRVHLSE